MKLLSAIIPSFSPAKLKIFNRISAINGLLDAEASANVEDGLAGDAVEFAEPVDGGVVGLGDLV